MATTQQEASRHRIEQIVRQFGCMPQDAPDGPIVEQFDPQKLSEALDFEMGRCAERGWTKVTLHMDVRDAFLLSRFLKSARTL